MKKAETLTPRLVMPFDKEFFSQVLWLKCVFMLKMSWEACTFLEPFFSLFSTYINLRKVFLVWNDIKVLFLMCL